ncbi:Glycosyltransferase Family 4 [Paenibacillus sp. UNCCL117]|uniref:glycosyltransferase family 4 protein n=1 Tax=unclassified Paenibacillus TaxID=185978 RepID=UPI00088BE1F8|nr:MULTISPECIES: glycosyltransferase family 4 protein [unclassified Paenibacillus]SDC02737.1 Glycosyltransferase Family 4 [Paenibacillus sp. cl123]SFW36913.1 Glycosyltransferase Family 4 [Paenibacillus sp. UNCCL117]
MTSRKKIVIVAHDVGGGGGMERHLEEVIMRLKQDADVTVVAASMKLADPSGVRFIRIPVMAKPVPLKMMVFAIMATLRLLFIKRDLLHTTGAIVANRADVSTVHFCHAGYVEATGNTRSKLNRSLLRRWNSALASSIALGMERLIYRPGRTRKLIAVSGRVRQELLASFPYEPHEVEVVPNGVDMSCFRPMTDDEKRTLRLKHGLPEHGRFVLFMGGDWPLKGLDYVIDAFNQTAPAYPDLHLLVVGKGDKEAYAPKIAEAVRSRVIFAGKRPNPEEWFGLSDLFIFPSSYETFSLVVHEAAAAGLVVLSTRVGGVEDLIEDGVNGYWIERDGEQIARRLRSVLDAPEEHAAMRERSRSRVSALTWDHTYGLMKDIYRSMHEPQYGSRGFDIERTHP